MSEPTSSRPVDNDNRPAASESPPPGFRRYDRFASILQAGTLAKSPSLSALEQRVTTSMIDRAANRTARLLVLLTAVDGVELALAAEALGLTIPRAREQLASRSWPKSMRASSGRSATCTPATAAERVRRSPRAGRTAATARLVPNGV